MKTSGKCPFPHQAKPSVPATKAGAPAGKAPEAKAQNPAPAPSRASSFSASVAPALNMDGPPAGPIGPSTVESPFTPEEKAALVKKIPCPALAGMFSADMLPVAKDGTVKIPDLENALRQLGPNSTVRKVLTNGADKTDSVAGQFNLFNLNGSNLDHTGSTGIRSNGVHPERFEVLKSFSKDGKTLTAKDLAEANDAFAKEDPGFKGHVTGQAEFAIIMEVFGHRSPGGTQYLTLDDAKSLFVDGKFPAGWSPPSVPDQVSLVDVLGKAALGLFHQLIDDL